MPTRYRISPLTFAPTQLSWVSGLFLLRDLRTTRQTCPCRTPPVDGLDCPAWRSGIYVWHLPVVNAIVPLTDRRRTMVEALMMGSMVTGVIASSMIAATLLLIVLNEL